MELNDLPFKWFTFHISKLLHWDFSWYHWIIASKAQAYICTRPYRDLRERSSRHGSVKERHGLYYDPLRRHRLRARLMLSHYSNKIPCLYCWSFVYNLPHRHQYKGQEVINGYSQATPDDIEVKWRGVLLFWMSVMSEYLYGFIIHLNHFKR